MLSDRNKHLFDSYPHEIDFANTGLFGSNRAFTKNKNPIKKQNKQNKKQKNTRKKECFRILVPGVTCDIIGVTPILTENRSITN